MKGRYLQIAKEIRIQDISTGDSRDNQTSLLGAQKLVVSTPAPLRSLQGPNGALNPSFQQAVLSALKSPASVPPIAATTASIGTQTNSIANTGIESGASLSCVGTQVVTPISNIAGAPKATIVSSISTQTDALETIDLKNERIFLYRTNRDATNDQKGLTPRAPLPSKPHVFTARYGAEPSKGLLAKNHAQISERTIYIATRTSKIDHSERDMILDKYQ